MGNKGYQPSPVSSPVYPKSYKTRIKEGFEKIYGPLSPGHGQIEQAALTESFNWLGSIDFPNIPKSNLVKVVALHPTTTTHPNQFAPVRHYVESELEKVAKTFIGGYISLDHYWVYDSPYRIIDSNYEDSQIETLCFVPDEIIRKIKDGDITKVSVGMDWQTLQKMDGVVPRGLKGLGVSFLEKLTPGDSQTAVELLEAWGQLLIKEAREGR